MMKNELSAVFVDGLLDQSGMRCARQLGMHAGGCYGPGYERGSQPLVGVGICEPTDGRDGGERSVSRLLV